MPAYQQATAVASLLATLLAAPSFAHAGAIDIFSTGVDSSGNLLPNGSIDPHWTVQTESYDTNDHGITATGGAFLTDYNGASFVGSYAYLPTAFPGGAGGYNLDTPTAGVIAWSPNNEGGYVAYTYRTTFDLSDPTSAQIVLTVVADDDAELALNGVLIPSTYMFRSGPETFTLDSGFVAGVNTLDVVSYNEGGAGGIMVTVDSTAAPEPATFALLATGLLGLLAVRRRHG